MKGLPKYVSEARLREHFSAKGEVTDAKVVKSKYAQSRPRAVIGCVATEFVSSASIAMQGWYL